MAVVEIIGANNYSEQITVKSPITKMIKGVEGAQSVTFKLVDGSSDSIDAFFLAFGTVTPSKDHEAELVVDPYKIPGLNPWQRLKQELHFKFYQFKAPVDARVEYPQRLSPNSPIETLVSKNNDAHRFTVKLLSSPTK
ncbi:MAG TPA: hypothetical protein VLE91_04380 [Candidatus Saccharimonadales bacterium]|nr:hypothetical protein [Candidatus Saccharimonadales bacterium]